MQILKTTNFCLSFIFYIFLCKCDIPFHLLDIFVTQSFVSIVLHNIECTNLRVAKFSSELICDTKPHGTFARGVRSFQVKT